MNFTFSEEQEELRRTIRRFLEEKSPSTEVRRLMETNEGYDSATWKQMAQELGLQGIAIPEEFGGQGFTFVELGIVLEEMGRVLLCAPFLSSIVLAANAILNAGTEAQKKELLPPIANGECIATLAFTDSKGDWSANGVTCVASKDGVLNGSLSFVLDGHVADVLVVAARDAGSKGTDGIGLFVVRRDAEGLKTTLLDTLDRTRKQATVELVNVKATRLGEPGNAWPALSHTLDQIAVGLSAEITGGAQRTLDMAVEYAKNRVQFGRPIGSFQAIKHKCADMLLKVESAKTATYYAMWAAADNNAELPTIASLAKAFCSDAFFFCATENIQTHGGIGFTWEHDAHLYFRRAKSSELLFGDPTYHRELVADRIGI
ncbi:MAG: acyl-CoA dehydrogenase family protein [Actinomycetota bacterium]